MCEATLEHLICKHIGFVFYNLPEKWRWHRKYCTIANGLSSFFNIYLRIFILFHVFIIHTYVYVILEKKILKSRKCALCKHAGGAWNCNFFFAELNFNKSISWWIMWGKHLLMMYVENICTGHNMMHNRFKLCYLIKCIVSNCWYSWVLLNEIINRFDMVWWASKYGENWNWNIADPQWLGPQIPPLENVYCEYSFHHLIISRIENINFNVGRNYLRIIYSSQT